MGTTPRAAIYVRVSSTGQAEKGASLDTQEAECRAYAAKRGYEVLQTYRETQSGYDFYERPQLAAAREAIRRKELDVLVVHDVDRLSRRTIQTGVVLSEAEHRGAAIEFVLTPQDGSPEAMLILYVKGYAAEIEREKIRERSWRGKRARVAAGKPLHSSTPAVGYRWADAEKTRYEADPLWAPVVVRIFEAYASGQSLQGVTAMMQHSGMAPRRGGKCWDRPTIRRILCNSAYAGTPVALKQQTIRRDGKRVQIPRPPEEWLPLSTDLVPPLIARTLFDAVQARLSTGRARSPRRLTTPEEYLLRGRVRCGHCGRQLTCRVVGRQGRVYHCHGAGFYCDRKPAMQQTHLDAQVWARVLAQLQQPDIIARELKRQEEHPPAAADLAAIEREQAKVTRQQANVARALAAIDDPDTAAPLVMQLHELADRGRQLDGERVRLAQQAAAWALAQTRLRDVQAWVTLAAERLVSADATQRRLALDALDVQVRLYAASEPQRWEVTASIPIDGFSVTCDNWHAPQNTPVLTVHWSAADAPGREHERPERMC